MSSQSQKVSFYPISPQHILRGREVYYLELAEVSLKQALERSTVTSFVTETLKNTAKTGIFNRLAQNQHKNIKIYAVDFSS